MQDSSAHVLLLQVVVFTYKRENEAIRACKSVLSINSQEIGLVLHSNEPSVTLRSFMDARGLGKFYGEHTSNMGPIVNHQSAVNLAQAKYIMLLSDEDEVDAESIRNIIPILRGGKENLFCLSLIRNYFCVTSKSNNFYSRQDALTRFSWILSYMSGFIYPRNVVSNGLLTRQLADCDYPHLIIKMMMGERDKLFIPSEPYIKKNEEAHYGGDSYVHYTDKSGVSDPKKNEEIYGYLGRIKQWLYLESSRRRYGLNDGWRGFWSGFELISIYVGSFNQAGDVTTNGKLDRSKARKKIRYIGASHDLGYKYLLLVLLLTNRLTQLSGAAILINQISKYIRRFAFGIRWPI